MHGLSNTCKASWMLIALRSVPLGWPDRGHGVLAFLFRGDLSGMGMISSSAQCRAFVASSGS
eukprot:15484257-Alexandrium_andersonii.AAC.1